TIKAAPAPSLSTKTSPGRKTCAISLTQCRIQHHVGDGLSVSTRLSWTAGISKLEACIGDGGADQQREIGERGMEIGHCRALVGRTQQLCAFYQQVRTCADRDREIESAHA